MRLEISKVEYHLDNWKRAHHVGNDSGELGFKSHSNFVMNSGQSFADKFDADELDAVRLDEAERCDAAIDSLVTPQKQAVREVWLGEPSNLITLAYDYAVALESLSKIMPRKNLL
jgi:hypothetical protein